MSKVIKINQCSICPYARNRSSAAKGDDRKCSAVDDDEEGYGVELTPLMNNGVPTWCPLENDDVSGERCKCGTTVTIYKRNSIAVCDNCGQHWPSNN